MWTRIYLLLLAVRLYFALSPSYIHPDENFQGPEVIAGKLFDSTREGYSISLVEGRPWEQPRMDSHRDSWPSRRPSCMRLA